MNIKVTIGGSGIVPVVKGSVVMLTYKNTLLLGKVIGKALKRDKSFVYLIEAEHPQYGNITCVRNRAEINPYSDDQELIEVVATVGLLMDELSLIHV